MDDDNSSTRTEFEAATDKRAHDIERLPKEDRDRVDEIRRQAEREKTAARAEHAEWRDRDIAEERAKILHEHPTMTYEMKLEQLARRRGPKLDDVDRMAEHEVDRRYAMELASIEVSAEVAIDAVI